MNSIETMNKAEFQSKKNTQVTQNILEILKYKFGFQPIIESLENYDNFNFKCLKVDKFGKF